MTVCPFPNPRTPPNIVPMRPSCRWNQSRPDAAGRGGPWRPIAPGLSASALQSAGCPEWYEMVQNGTETQFFPGPPNGRTGRGMALAPYCPWPLRTRTAICRPYGMGQNGTEWYGNSILPRRANQQASPGHGHRAPLPMASLHPHCNLPALRNGTRWDKMVGELNFSPAGQPASRSGAWPSRPIAHGLSVPALQSAGPTEWDEMGRNGRGTQFFPGPPTSKPVRGMAKEYQSGRS